MRAIPLLPLVLLLAAAPAVAQEGRDHLSVDPATVRACHDGAAPGDVAPSCIGAASGTCQGLPRGDTTLGLVACMSAEAEAWDVLLNEEYALLRGEAEAMDRMEGGESRARALRDAQRAWIAFRDGDCRLAWALWQGGTIRGPVAADCHMVHTARRALELRGLRRDGEGGL